MEINELLKISEFTLGLCNFINLNMRSIKLILKKFDKKLGKVYGKITQKFLKDSTEGGTSNLMYILKFKANLFNNLDDR